MDYDTWLEEPYQRQAAAEEALEAASDAEHDAIWASDAELSMCVQEALGTADSAALVLALRRDDRELIGGLVRHIVVEHVRAEAERRARLSMEREG